MRLTEPTNKNSTKTKIYMSVFTESQYLPIWNRLKQTGQATIVADPRLHRRLIKAVQARRDRDLAFRHQVAEDGKKHRITWEIRGNTIHFTLTYRLSIYGL